MNQIKSIQPSKIDGTITAPASKSDMLRAVAAAYLTGTRCEILNPSFCDDARAALGIIEQLGTQVEISAERILCTPGIKTPNPVLNCGESGLCVRMFPAIAALCDDAVTLTGGGSLLTRPIDMLEQPLRDLGVECSTRNGLLPVTIKGALKAGKTTIDGSVTSQFLTGLLMALPLCEGTSEITVTQLASTPYIEMTLSVLRTFGIHIENQQFKRFIINGSQTYHAPSYTVEGDWSGAAFPLVAGAIAGNVRVEQLNLNSYQADQAIIKALASAGARVILEKNAVEVQSRPLTGFEFDATNCPDLFPPLIALAVHCAGKSVIFGAHRLIHKESHRGNALLQEFTKLGAAVALYEDRMEIEGGQLTGGTVDSHNDHRIAMACATAGLKSEQGVTITNCECVAKSYPEFFDDFVKLGVMV